MTALYNEIDPYAAQWLRNLIAAGVIAPGDVCETDIRDLRPSDIAGYTQFHAFAGIGVWSYAARLAGWPDDRPLWTGSCPCQPFSAAGKGGGFDDERHLWPHWHHLIRVLGPADVFGEQVASKDGYAWLDLVQADMEGLDYACGPHVSPSAGFGAPHERHRIRVGAKKLEHAARDRWLQRWTESSERGALSGRGIGVLDDDDDDEGLEGHAGDGHGASGWALSDRSVATASSIGGMADADGEYAGTEGLQRSRQYGQQQEDGRTAQLTCGWTGPLNGFWRDADWLFCRDDKWRPVEPGTFPLVDGAAFRLDSGSAFAGKWREGILRGAGNAVDAEATMHFIEAYLECEAIEHEPRRTRLLSSARDVSEFSDLLG